MFGIDDLILGGILGNAISGIGSALFGGDERMPENRANEHLSQVPKILEKHYGPWEHTGIRAIPSLERQYAQLINNPEILMSQVGSNYRASPGYGFKKEEAARAANHAAAAAGMLGTPAHQEAIARTITGLADQDYYNYLQNALGLYGTGLSGQGYLANLGYNAASSLGENLSNAAMSRGNLAYTSGQNELSRNRGLWGNIGGALGALGGANNWFSAPHAIHSTGSQNPNAYWTSSPTGQRQPLTGSGYITDYLTNNMFR
ncbi:hypothetical protein HGB13_00290 [bacterium]|nr:hypothetical protein [bacterium]